MCASESLGGGSPSKEKRKRFRKPNLLFEQLTSPSAFRSFRWRHRAVKCLSGQHSTPCVNPIPRLLVHSVVGKRSPCSVRNAVYPEAALVYMRAAHFLDQ